MLEKCNRDVFMELDQSIANRSILCNNSLLDASRANITPLKTANESPINFAKGVSALPEKANETFLDDF